MGMAKTPHIHQLNQIGEIAQKGSTNSPHWKSRMLAKHMRAMMRDGNSYPIKRSRQSPLQPSSRFLVNLQRILRKKFPATIANHTMIIKTSLDDFHIRL